MPARRAAEVLRRHALTVALIALAACAALILWLGAATDIDLRLADAAFDSAMRDFPMRHAWIAEQFNHVILKAAMAFMGGGIIMLAAVDAMRPRRSWTQSRRTGIRVSAMSAVLVPTLTSLLKHGSVSHCPWDLQRYGGGEAYSRLLEWVPEGVRAGHCLPAGHASSVLWLIALASFWWPRRPGIAISVGAAMAAFGGAVGWMQQLRGAHFLTHTLWSVWIASALVLLIYLFNTKGLAWLRSIGYSSVPRNAA